MIPTKTMTPHVPVTPAEVIDEACRALERGVAIVHLHARDEHGNPTYRGEIYETMILGIRRALSRRDHLRQLQRPELPRVRAAERGAGLTGAARPDLASLTLTSLDFPTGTSQNDPDMVIAPRREDGEPGASSRSSSASTSA